MKIILSRKGFDSAYGKVPSPILPSGELYSLPIPETMPSSCSRQYKDIMIHDYSIGTIVYDLTRGYVTPETPTHLDPDLNHSCIPRPKQWKPIFGQAGAAESHLQNQGIKHGDVFLFFGWFKQVEQVAGKYQFVKNASNLHVIFGWLQIEQRIPVDSLSQIPIWALDHPHCKTVKYGKQDCIYTCVDRMKLPCLDIDKSGAGTFKKFHPALTLTAPNATKKSTWQLPKWFYPEGKKSILNISPRFKALEVKR